MYDFNILDITPYVILYFICVYNSLKIKDSNLNWITIALIVFSSIRYGIGYDYYSYVNRIMINNQSGETEWLSNIFMIISYELEWPQLYFIINTLIAIVPIRIVVRKYSSNPTLSLLAYFLIPLFFLESMSIVRNASAYSIIFLSYYYLKERKYIKYLMLCILAGGLHSSGYIGFILFPLIKLPIGKKSNYIILLSALIILTINLNIDYFSSLLSKVSFLKLYNKMFWYLDQSKEQGRFVKYIIFSIGITNTILWRQLTQINFNNKSYITFFNFGLLIWAIFSFDNTISLRLSSFLLLFEIIIVPSYIMIRLLKSKLLSKVTTYAFFTIFFCSTFVVNILNYEPKMDKKISFLPYQTIFSYVDYSNYKL